MKKNKKSISTLKNKFLNTLMSNGKKNTTEKILLSSAKRIYRLKPINFKLALKLAIINATPLFKLNEQLVKKGKRKIKKQIPFFLVGEYSRLMQGLKIIKLTSDRIRQADPFYKSVSLELINLIEEKSAVLANNNDIKTQAISNKRHLSKFRW